MLRIPALFAAIALVLAGCATPPPPTMGPDGRPLPRVYRISAADADEVQFRMDVQT